MKNHKGKTTGIMMEGSAMHMSMLHKESAEQEKKDLMKDMPVDDKASAMEMSPYKMGHESPAEFTGMSGGSAFHQENDERSGKGKSITEGIELDEATASLSDMYKRDANLTVPDFPQFTTTSSGYTQVGNQYGGSVEPFPSAVYIGKGTSVPGVGRTFSEKDISAGREKYEKLKARKEKAKSWLAANM